LPARGGAAALHLLQPAPAAQVPRRGGDRQQQQAVRTAPDHQQQAGHDEQDGSDLQQVGQQGRIGVDRPAQEQNDAGQNRQAEEQVGEQSQPFPI
jgi:hypothetical protein